MSDFRKIEIAMAVFVFSALLMVYEIVRLNDENVQLSKAERWCNVSYQNRIETRPCTISNELANVEVKL